MQRSAIPHVLAIAVLVFCLLVFWGDSTCAIGQESSTAKEAEILAWGGETMGTTYSVKVFHPTAKHADLRFSVDGVLRRVNDQMSTYLKSSEVSRFNSSDSTDWFDVSQETAMVVEFAQQVSTKTNGAFDITIGPVVNAWSFGPDPRTQTLPSQDKLDALMVSVGFAKLHVRLDPPAIKKSTAELKIDLSAIAKGHAVDRVVKLLRDLDASNVFVEIGGEVGTSGNKGGQHWKVGIQVPDTTDGKLMVAHALGTDAGNDRCMATSGDYRNFFEVDGVLYSHTIDPRTARPIEHSLASVSVLSDSCMQADAWATAINVLGPEQGIEIARTEGLDVLLANRDEQGFNLVGNGALARYASSAMSEQVVGQEMTNSPRQNSPFVTVGLTVIAFALLLFAMAIGVIFGRRAIRGSCGGLANASGEDGSSCSLCSNPSDACKELRERMQKDEPVGSTSDVQHPGESDES